MTRRPDGVVRVYDACYLSPVAGIEGIAEPAGILNTERRLGTLGR